MRLKPRQGALLIDTHEPPKTGDVGGENGSQPAFDAFRHQSGLPDRMGRIDYRLSDAF